MRRVPEHVHQQRIRAALALVDQVEVAGVHPLELDGAGHDLDGKIDAEGPPLRLHRLAHLLAVEDGPADAQGRAVFDARHPVRLADAVAVPVDVSGLVEQPHRGLGIVGVVVGVAIPVASMDRVQGAVRGQVVPVVQKVVERLLVGAVQQGPPHPDVVEGRSPHVHDHLQPGPGLIAGEQRKPLRVAVVVDVGGGQVHGDVRVAGADDVAQHGLLADEADRHALDPGRAGLRADRVPAAVAVPAPHGDVVVGHPLLEQERSGAHQMAVELLDSPALGGCGRPDRDAPESIEHGHPGDRVMERDRGVVDDLDALDRSDVRRHLAGPGRRVEDALDVVPDGLRAEGRAVLEDHAAPERERPLVRHIVRGPGRGQSGVERAIRADDQQGVGDHVVDEPRRLVRFDVAVQGGGFA